MISTPRLDSSEVAHAQAFYDHFLSGTAEQAGMSWGSCPACLISLLSLAHSFKEKMIWRGQQPVPFQRLWELLHKAAVRPFTVHCASL